MTRQLLPLLLAFSICQTEAVFADGPAKDVPELRALSNYIGTWNTKITSKGSPFTKGQHTAEWILDGRFLQQNVLLTLTDSASVLKSTTLMTYDQKAKAYRVWTFASNGIIREALGKWDTKTSTMTTAVRRGDMTSITIATFADEGVEKWAWITKNQNNEVLSRITGTSIRTKE